MGGLSGTYQQNILQYRFRLDSFITINAGFSGTVTNNNGVIEIVFPPLSYNNTSNLVIAAEENSSGYDNNNYDEAMHVYNGAQNSTLYYKNDYTDPDPASPPATGNLVNYKSVVTFQGWLRILFRLVRSYLSEIMLLLFL
jgi:hypothetical protein